MKIAAIHFEQTPGDDRSREALEAAIDANERRLLEIATTAAVQGAQLIVTPELPIVPHPRKRSLLRYSSRPGDVANSRRFAWWFANERAPRFLDGLRKQVVEGYGCHVATTILDVVPGHRLIHARAVLLSPGGAQHAYDKRYLTGDAVYAARGRSPLVPAALSLGKMGGTVEGNAGGNVGVVVCADYCAPLIIRALVLNGSDLVVVPAQLGSDGDSVVRSLSVRARENGIPLVLANSFSAGGAYEGEQSAIVTFDGEVAQRSGGDTGTVLWADLDLQNPAAARLRKAKLASRRPELYQGALLNLTARGLRPPLDGGRAAPISRMRIVTVSGAAVRSDDLNRRLGVEAERAVSGGTPLLVVFPEFRGERAEAEPLLELARRCRAYVAIGYAEANRKILILLDPAGTELLRYQKVHLHAAERDSFEAGDTLESYIDVPPDARGLTARIGLLSGDDLLYPEATAIQRNAGVDLLLVPAALDFDGTSVFDDIAKAGAVNVAASDWRYRGGVFRRYPDPFETPLEAYGDTLNVMEFDVCNRVPSVPPVEQAGLECLVRLGG